MVCQSHVSLNNPWALLLRRRFVSVSGLLESSKGCFDHQGRHRPNATPEYSTTATLVTFTNIVVSLLADWRRHPRHPQRLQSWVCAELRVINNS